MKKIRLRESQFESTFKKIENTTRSYEPIQKGISTKDGVIED